MKKKKRCHAIPVSVIMQEKKDRKLLRKLLEIMDDLDIDINIENHGQNCLPADREALIEKALDLLNPALSNEEIVKKYPEERQFLMPAAHTD